MSDTDRHPEDYCHRCGGPNISWYTPGAVWDPVMRADGEWKWGEIICPLCFVELAPGGTWGLIPAKDDGEQWTGADERAQIVADGRAEGWDEGFEAAIEWVESCGRPADIGPPDPPLNPHDMTRSAAIDTGDPNHPEATVQAVNAALALADDLLGYNPGHGDFLTAGKRLRDALCACYWTPEETWLSAASCGYGSGYEPGSQMEWNPECPIHPGNMP